MTITPEIIKKYLRIEHNEDNGTIENLLETAKTLMKETTGVAYTEGDTTYELLLKFVVQYYYYNRSAISDKAAVELPYTIENLINRISFRGALPSE